MAGYFVSGLEVLCSVNKERGQRTVPIISSLLIGAASVKGCRVSLGSLGRLSQGWTARNYVLWVRGH